MSFNLRNRHFLTLRDYTSTTTNSNFSNISTIAVLVMLVPIRLEIASAVTSIYCGFSLLNKPITSSIIQQSL